MKVIIEKIPYGATLQDVIHAFNKAADRLNEGLCEIDEENISESVMKKINKEV